MIPVQQQSEITKTYANIMGEVKVRFDAINIALSGQLNVASPFVREFCFLQLRLVCELIALGCLVAHGDVSPKLKKEYSAGKIMAQLEDLNPHFFPQPYLQQKLEPHRFHLENRQKDYITKPELLSLYAKGGSVLHKGNIKKLLKSQMPLQYNFPEIAEPSQRILNLLSLHRIHLHGGEWQLLCTLKNMQDNGNVQVALAQASEFPGSREALQA